MRAHGIPDVDDLYNRPRTEFVALVEQVWGGQAAAPAPRRCRLVVNDQFVLLDGIEVPLPGSGERCEEVRYYLRLLIAAGGNRLSGPDAVRAAAGDSVTLSRIDRLLRGLPQPLFDLIETTRQGSRLRPEAWHT
jgi:hypothetical protein